MNLSVRRAQLVAGVDATASAAQPFAVKQMRTREFRAERGNA